MLREARRLLPPRAVLFGVFLATAPFGLVSTLPALQGGGTSSPAAVLVVVPPGSKLAVVERTRSAVHAPRRALLVADSDRVVLDGGFEMLVDRSFARAPDAEVIVLAEGEPGRAEEAFLTERRKTAKAILLPRGSRLAEKLREGGSGGALILLGGSESIAPLLDAFGESGSARANASSTSEVPVAGPAPTAIPPTPAASGHTATSPAAAAENPPARTPTPATARVFDRYFSSSRPTPTPTPR
ncbi:MAG TPA: hypothetical protein VF958_12530 [Thermoanaerobaculia bacterium]